MKKYVSWALPMMLTLVLALCVPAGAVTVVLQPGPEGKDATVEGHSSSEYNNQGARDRLYVSTTSGYYDGHRRSYVEFDLSSVNMNPDDVAAVRFTLVSYERYTSAPTYDVVLGLYQVTESWIEGIETGAPPTIPCITYTAGPPGSGVGQPVTGFPTALATLSTPGRITSAEEAAGGRLLVWDSEEAGNSGLKDLVKGWLAGTTDNFGLMARVVNENKNGTNHRCHSSDYDWVSGGYTFNPLPKLEINPAAGPTAELIRSPYLQNVTPDGVSVMWGSSDADAGTVHWGTSPGDYTNSAASTRITDTQGNYVHTARIDGLSPGQTVYYYVDANTTGGAIGQGNASYHATAAPAGNGSFRFVVYGDSRYPNSGYPWGFPDVVNAMTPYNPDITVHTGDIVMDGNLWEYNDYYFAPTASLGKNTPVFPVLGNHELRPGSNVQNYRDVYGLPTNSVDGTEDYYSFDHGCIHFVMLDSELLYDARDEDHRDATRAAEQKAWLEADLDATTKRWKVVSYHRPMHYYESVQEAWLETFEEKGVDLVLEGHFHNYASHYHNGVYYITTGGGGAEMTGGSAGDWPEDCIGTFDHDFHFVVIDAALDKLKVEVYDVDDALRHAFTIVGDVIPGDANGNGIVDDEDASILAAHWQQTGMGWEHGDFNDDGIVNDADASILAAHWQESESNAPVPEPTGIVLLLGGMVLLFLLTRCRGCLVGGCRIPE